MTTTPTLRDAAQQALKALVHMTGVLNAAGWATGHADAAVKALSAALAEQAAEQAGPAALDVTLTEEDTSFLRDTVASEDGDPPPPIRLIVGHGHSGYGLYVSLAEYGDEGSSLLTALAAPPAPARQEPLFLLHTGQIDSGGEQDEWDIEANSWVSVEEFCLAHPGQTIGLHPQPLPAAPITAAPAEGGAA